MSSFLPPAPELKTFKEEIEHRLKWEHHCVVDEDAVDHLEKIFRELAQAFIDTAVHLKDPKYKTMRLADMLLGVQMVVNTSYEMRVRAKVTRTIQQYSYLMNQGQLSAKAAMARMQEIEFKADTFQQMFKDAYPNIKVSNEAYLVLQSITGMIFRDLFSNFSYRDVRIRGHTLDSLNYTIDRKIYFRNMFYRHGCNPTSIDIKALPPLTKSMYDKAISKINHKIYGNPKKLAPDAMQYIQPFAAGLLNRVLKIIYQDTECSNDYDHLYKVLHQEMLANQIFTWYDYMLFESHDKSLQDIVERFKEDPGIPHETIVAWVEQLSEPQGQMLNDSTTWMAHLIVESYIINILEKSMAYTEYMQRTIITSKHVEVAIRYV